jgi:hypothetical protein
MAKPKLKIPRTNNQREVDAWRRGQDDGNFASLTQDDVLGTSKQVIVTKNANGTITLSTPQNIDTDADVTFDTLTIDKIIFSLVAGLTPAEGEMCWNADDGTLNLGMPGGDVVLQIGQELLAPKAKAIGSDINNGDLVYVSGGSGSNPEMTLAKADALETSRHTIAMATEDILQNQLGFYTAFGLVRDINTAAYSAGDILYLSAATAGKYTDTEPGRPNFSVKIGIVIRSHATEGIIFVDIEERGLVCLQQDNVKLLLGAGSDASMYYNGTDLYLLTDEVAASDFKIDCGTDKTLELQESVWDDIQFPISSGRRAVANQPTWTALTTNTSEFAFDIDDYIDLSSNELNHGWKEGTTGNFHLHIAIPVANATGSSRYAQFTLYVAYVNASKIWTETSLTAEYEIPDGSSINENFYLDMGDVSFSGLTIGTQVKCRIKRIAATGGTEYADDVFIHQVGLHVEYNTIGSRQEGTK